MTKILLAICLAFFTLHVSNSVNAAIVYTGGNFTMLDPNGYEFGGTNDVSWTFEETAINSAANGTVFNGDISTDTQFFGFIWTTHDVRVFEEGIYSFDTTCTSSQIASGISVCGGSPSEIITMEVGAGQLGAHILFDYNLNIDSDIIIVWDRNSPWDDAGGSYSSENNLWLGQAGESPDPLLSWELVSTDANGDGINGVPMIDGPFSVAGGAPGNFNPNFNFGQMSPVPIPAAAWLFGSGFLGLIGLTNKLRRQRAIVSNIDAGQYPATSCGCHHA